ncbi:MAG: PEP-CTERM sorting domain-containing protein, partial [Verrucomicrobiota bacterium]
TYDFYAYTTGDVASNGRNLAMQLGAITQQSLAMTDVVTRNTFTQGVNYLLFSNIQVTNGTLSGSWWNPGGGTEANFNGFQLQRVEAVPEPGSMILTGLALAGMGGAAWRRRKGKTAPVETPEASA